MANYFRIKIHNIFNLIILGLKIKYKLNQIIVIKNKKIV